MTASMLVSASGSGAKRVLESQVEPLTMTSVAAYQPCKATKGVQDRTLQTRQRTIKRNCFAEVQLVTFRSPAHLTPFLSSHDISVSPPLLSAPSKPIATVSTDL